jgi:hypothetical protein
VLRVVRGLQLCKRILFGAIRGARRTPGGQSGISNFIDECTIADLKCGGGFAPVPLVSAQGIQNHVSLKLLYCGLGDAFQGHGPDRHFDLRFHRRSFPCDRLAQGGLRPDQYVASHAIGKLADISGPIGILQIFDYFRSKRF